MLNQYWRQFKSGTDIRGVAVEGVPDMPCILTDDAVAGIVKGFALWLDRTVINHVGPLKVAVGHDSRISSERIRAVVVDTLVESGFSVKDCGLASTPAMFMTTVELGCDGAIQITASHHPYYRNGLKFFTRAGGLNSSDIEQILAYAQSGETLEKEYDGTLEQMNFMKTYCERLRDLICKGVNADDYSRPLRGYHIVVDAGNGVGGFYADRVLEPLGADVTGSVYLEPDGMFPNHIPNPEDAQAMHAVSTAVIAAGADLGVIFDTDVDRAACVDANGHEINKNRLIALAARIALEDNDGATVVTDSTTSDGLRKFIEQTLHGKHHRFKRGYKNVINEATRLNEAGVNCPLAIETSGHAALRENYFLDDGAYLMTKIIIKMAQLGKAGQKLEDLIAELEEPAESVEVRLHITQEDFRPVGEALIERVTAACEEKDGYHVAPDNHEGVRVSFDEAEGDGWFLLRLSVHDPVMPVNLESRKPGGCKQIAGKLYALIHDAVGVDITPLRDFIG